MADVATVLAILDDLVAIPTVPGQKNREWLGYVSSRLAGVGCSFTEVPSPAGDCRGLIACTGPETAGGLVLSGHVDVVSTEGQDWSSDPFRLRKEGGRVYGRGVADMKGFVACAIAVMEEACRQPVSRPLYLALSADEESTCQSAISLAAFAAQTLPAPRGVLMGEPTRLHPVNRHKGSYTNTVDVTGRAAHASLPELGASATALAARLMTWVDDQSAGSYAPSATTHSVGVVEGGSASNIIAGQCRFEWDIRLAPGDDLEEIERRFLAEADRHLAALRKQAPESGVTVHRTASFPGFRTPSETPFAQECLAVSGAADPGELAAGTEAGIYAAAGLPVIIMGPGDIAQAHIADEFLDIRQLESCVLQLKRLQ